MALQNKKNIEPNQNDDRIEGLDFNINLTGDDEDHVVPIEDAKNEYIEPGNGLSDIPDFDFNDFSESAGSDELTSDFDELAELGDEESVTLSDEELGNILEDSDSAEHAEVGGEPAEEEDFLLPELPEGDEEDVIALSDDELENILGDVQGGPFETEESETGEGLAPEEEESVRESLDSEFSFIEDYTKGEIDLTAEEEGPIALTPEELGRIESDVQEKGQEVSTILDEEDEGPIALSESELENILENVNGEEPPPYSAYPGEQRQPYHLDLEDIEEAPAAGREAQTSAVAEHPLPEGLDRDELKKMIAYLDALFDNLPDKTIKEFSKSEYFDLYKKIMSELGL
jgi:hypothetical protein